MHILVVNDDGPPNDSRSPYIVPFVAALQEAGHSVSVVVPDTPQSWISKAHLAGKVLTTRPLSPDPHGCGDGVEWTLVNGTPASCTQLGLFHLTAHRDPVDLVVSGPGWGRNVTTLYNLASGTIGGALEAAQCGKKAIAVSFACKLSHQVDVIEAACAVSANLIGHLYQTWANEVELYAINVPMISGLASRRIVYTQSLPSYWARNSLFQEVKSVETNGHAKDSTRDPRGERKFTWKPDLQNVEQSINRSQEATDAWAMREGFISVTPMLATLKSVDRLCGNAVL